MSRRPSVSILVPVYDEAPRLPALFRALGRLRVAAEVIAVDDGSTDGSLELLRKRARRSRLFRVLAHPRNRGKGAAIRTALRASRGRTVVLMDADLECDPRDIPKLLAVLARHPGHAVFGTRFPRTSWPTATRLANHLLTGCTNLLFGAPLTDMACGFKALPAARLKALHLEATRFELEAELTAGLLGQGVPIVEVPVRYRPRSYGQGKKIHPLDGLRILWRLLLLRLRHPASPPVRVVR